MKKIVIKVLCMFCALSFLLCMTACNTDRRSKIQNTTRTSSESGSRTNSREESRRDGGNDRTNREEIGKGPMNAQELVKYLDTRVVKVTAADGWHGSGFFIDANGTIATNFHVIDGATSLSVSLPDGGEYQVKEVINFIPECDIALIKVNVSGNDYLRLSRTVNKGEEIYVYGCPKSFDFTLTTGIVSGTNRKIGNLECFQVDAAVNPGNSGGPVVKNNGEVIGIATLGTNAQNTNFAINSEVIDKMDQTESMSMNEYIEWSSKDARRSYYDLDGNATHIHTYTTVTGSKCLASSNDLTDYIDGYLIGHLFYIYDFRDSEYDEYCDYLRSIGYEFDGTRTEMGYEMDVYSNELNGYSILMLEETFSGTLVVSCPII